MRNTWLKTYLSWGLIAAFCAILLVPGIHSHSEETNDAPESSCQLCLGLNQVQSDPITLSQLNFAPDFRMERLILATVSHHLLTIRQYHHIRGPPTA